MTRIACTELPLIENLSDDCDQKRTFGCFENAIASERRPALPLAKVAVEADVVERIASVKVTQTFVNLLKEPIEAVYIFPMAGSSAVSKFQMQVGARTIDGVIKERGEARQEYRQAVSEGKRAAILEQERDDVFTAQVGNIMPGEEITVTIIYSERLTYFASGHSEIRLPLVVAPRYIPGTVLNRPSVGEGVELDTNIVPDASRISPPRLAHGLDAKIDLTLTVNLQLNGEDEILDLACSQHAVKSSFKKNGITVTLASEKEMLDRDFVLSWKVAQGATSSLGLISHEAVEIGGEKYCYGMVSINPPAKADNETYLAPRDIVFVLDRSGSMQGLKMSSAASALSILLNTLTPRDRFSICAFDDAIEWFTDRRSVDNDQFFPASLKILEKGQTYLRKIEARGGTEMHGALAAVGQLIQGRRKKKRQAVVVVITDGEIGNDAQIFKFVQTQMADCRIFSVGIDTAVHDSFLKRLANLGGGTCSLVTPGEALESALTHVAREIGVPLITDLQIEDELTAAPSKSQDLFEGRPVSIFFRVKHDQLPAKITVCGDLQTAQSQTQGFSQVVDLLPTENQALPQLYARARVAELEDLIRSVDQNDARELQKEIVELAVAHSLLTRFTAFLAIDQAVVSDGDPRLLVEPVSMPDQWSNASQLLRGAAGRLAAMNMPCPPSGPPPAGGGWGCAPGSSWGSAAESQIMTGSWGAAASANFGAFPIQERGNSQPTVPQPSAPAAPAFRQAPLGSGLNSAESDLSKSRAANSEHPDLKALLALLADLQEQLDALVKTDSYSISESIEAIYAALRKLQTNLTALVSKSSLSLEIGSLGRLSKWHLANLMQAVDNQLSAEQVIVLATACGEQVKAVHLELKNFQAGSNQGRSDESGQKKQGPNQQRNDQFWKDNI